ncbi:hypothetical protein LXL04_005764 [Taraxacum kok-saghyz]
MVKRKEESLLKNNKQVVYYLQFSCSHSWIRAWIKESKKKPNTIPKIMANKILPFTFFTLFLFTSISAGRLPANPPATNPPRESLPSAGPHILLPGEKPKSDSDKSTATHPLPVPEKRTNFSRFHPINRHFHGKPLRGVKPIGGHRRPYRKSVTQNVIPRIEVADRKETGDLNPETFRREVPSKPIPYRKSVTQNRIPRIEVADRKESDDLNPETFRRPFRKSVSEYRVPRNRIEVADRKENGDSNPESFRGEVPSEWLKMKQRYGSPRHRNQPCNNNVIKTTTVFDREKLKSLMREYKQKKSEEETGFMKNIRKFLKHSFD